ncbi:MAG: serine/threonine-protein kinase [Polyangiaceae bacterium]
MATPSVGDVLVGKYRVDRVLGEGGMGVVFAATNTLLDQPVAIKVLRAEVLSDATVRKRFEREARAAAKLQSDHVARVLDVGELPDGEPYLVMEFLSGEDLANAIIAQGRLSPTEAVDAVLEACDAVAEAHALGIVHRDLKPANLFRAKLVDGTTRIKVLDFGIAKKIVSNGSSSTTTGHGLTGSTQLLGSPLYMSPEQLVGGTKIDARTDVWSFGVILFELLSGTSPFDAGSIPQVFAAILERAVPPLPSRWPEVPAELDKVVARCLSRDPKNRFASAADLSRALAPFGSAKSKRAVERAMKFLPAAGLDLATDDRATVKPSTEADPGRGASTATAETRVGDGPAVSAKSGVSPAANTNTSLTADVRRPANKTWIYAAVGAVVVAAGVGVSFALRSPEAPASATATAAPTGAPAGSTAPSAIAEGPPPTIVPKTAPSAVTADSAAPSAAPSASAAPLASQARTPSRPTAIPPRTPSTISTKPTYTRPD